MKKRIMSVFLALVLMIGTVVVSASAETSTDHAVWFNCVTGGDQVALKMTGYCKTPTASALQVASFVYNKDKLVWSGLNNGKAVSITSLTAKLATVANTGNRFTNECGAASMSFYGATLGSDKVIVRVELNLGADFEDAFETGDKLFSTGFKFAENVTLADITPDDLRPATAAEMCGANALSSAMVTQNDGTKFYYGSGASGEDGAAPTPENDSMAKPKVYINGTELKAAPVTLTGLSISGDASITVLVAGEADATATYTYTETPTGADIADDAAWSVVQSNGNALTDAQAGFISINSSGVLTVKPNAPTTDVIVRFTSGSVVGSKDVSIARASSTLDTSSVKILKGASGTTEVSSTETVSKGATLVLRASAKDQYGADYDVSGATWSSETTAVATVNPAAPTTGASTTVSVPSGATTNDTSVITLTVGSTTKRVTITAVDLPENDLAMPTTPITGKVYGDEFTVELTGEGTGGAIDWTGTEGAHLKAASTGESATFVVDAVGTNAVTVKATQAATSSMQAADLSMSVTTGKKAVTAVVAEQTKVYGAAVDTSSWSATISSGLVGTDTSAGVLTGTTYGTTATANSAVGKYNITGTAGTAAAKYDITFSGTEKLTITKKPVTATIATATKVYGTENPSFSATIPDGDLVGTDAQSAITYTLSSTATATSAVGTYDITGTATADNYDVTVTTGTDKLTITGKKIAITGEKSTTITGKQVTEVTLDDIITVTGLVGDEKLTQALTATSDPAVFVVKNSRDETVVTVTLYAVTETPGASEGDPSTYAWTKATTIAEKETYAMDVVVTADKAIGNYVVDSTGLAATVPTTAAPDAVGLAITIPEAPAPTYTGGSSSSNKDKDKDKTEKEHFINGYPDGKFRPGNLIKRSEIAQMIANLHKVFDKAIKYPSSGRDVPADQWYTAPVNFCGQEGIMTGDEVGMRPEDTIKRSELAVVLVRFLGLELDTNTGFADVKADDWYAGYVGALKKAGITKGYEDNTFRADQDITRSEAAAMFNRALKLTEADVDAFDIIPADLDDIADWAKQEILISMNADISSKKK